MADVPESLKEYIEILPYVDYFDFLKLCDEFDALLVMDAKTKDLKINNPYLPSKLSDYIGSQTTILALVEEGSPMSEVNSDKIIYAKLIDKKINIRCTTEGI
ncbi:hypothetical protein HPC37_10715 [Pasteurellaceae bacterium 20609_3]|nr:hypothetical protein [Spirabiliibacterium mucosae]